MEEGSHEAIRANDDLVSASEVRELPKRVREIERVLGEKTFENEIFKDALELAREKNSLRAYPHCRTRIRREKCR